MRLLVKSSQIASAREEFLRRVRRMVIKSAQIGRALDLGLAQFLAQVDEVLLQVQILQLSVQVRHLMAQSPSHTGLHTKLCV